VNSSEIRRQFLDFFAARGHRVVRSSSLIPADDPTLLFTNAGMNQFKEVFLGREKRDYARAATAQKCMRAGGKHNDLENVGYTNRHLTFFEMLGNFSFGDYFKPDAIRFAWELMTTGYRLDPEKLHATVYLDDDEAYALWKDDVKLPPARISRHGAADNFWAMGDTGPCGPCSELHYDTGLPGCGREGCGPGCDCGRFVELWNLVFMQFDRDGVGTLTPLPKPSIDTGMGLERITMVLQGVSSVYDTDLLRPIVDCTAALAGTAYGQADLPDVALRVIADHLRSSTFLLADGALPANEGRGYVLRRILRRALRFGKRLGFERPFLHQLTGVVVERMGEAYPELTEAREHIARVVRTEEERFARTLIHSGRAFEDLAAALEAKAEKVIPGPDAFRLYDTFGLPLDTLKDMAEVRGLTVDEPGYEAGLKAARETARESWKGGEAARGGSPAYRSLVERDPIAFVGYDRTALADARVRALLRDEREVAAINPGERCEVVLDATPFYPEGGGQVGDQGTLSAPGVLVRIEDTAQPFPGLIVHRAVVESGSLHPGDLVSARVEASRRRAAALNHSATHLLHAALRNVLGEHVKQAGSRVAPDRLRFDFSHHARVEPEDIRRIEQMVNQRVGLNDRVETAVLSIEEALGRGAIAFFGEKYGDQVRVVRMGDFSMELCGGTHVEATGNIGSFVLVCESGIASGVRRVEALTGDAAVLKTLEDRQVLEELSGRLHVPLASLVAHVESLRLDLKEARKEVADLRLRLASGSAAVAGGTSEFRAVGGARVAVKRVEGLDQAGMRALADELRNRLKSGVVILGAERDGKAAILVSVTSDLTDRVDAGQVVKELATIVGGSGGGRRDMAQAGGPDVARLGAALARGEEIVAGRLGP
jgi:alanyl-tRNA synthetase